VIVAATEAGYYEERTCLRCLEGRVYDAQQDAWVACERCGRLDDRLRFWVRTPRRKTEANFTDSSIYCLIKSSNHFTMAIVVAGC
jgi:hypothetical protein